MYGKFATAILNRNEKEFEEARSACVGFLPHAQVSYYVSMFFDRNYKTDWWYDLFGPRRQPKRAFLLLVLVVSLMVSYLLISE